eukprot:TRINITY_DN1002_c0_g1_i1.p1 TRINITY_DN1002_c0_g1~~TRINITY_DN1002_c0_g1_i1.p1  ORF type:complete len:121 (+),score=50.91 TRINITY_DN1002_c0_g1_i1:98-460(+)
MASAKAKFEQLAQQEAAEKKQREDAQKKREEEQRKRNAGGITNIGTMKGQIKSFATAFEAKADGNDVQLGVRQGGWQPSYDATSAASGKWQGGPAGMTATVIKKEEPRGPPPKRSLNTLS